VQSSEDIPEEVFVGLVKELGGHIKSIKGADGTLRLLQLHLPHTGGYTVALSNRQEAVNSMFRWFLCTQELEMELGAAHAARRKR
jgi:hypothetical protein